MREMPGGIARLGSLGWLPCPHGSAREGHGMVQRVRVTADLGSKGNLLSPGSAKVTVTGGVPIVETRQYVTMDHLWTARHAARLCGELVV